MLWGTKVEIWNPICRGQGHPQTQLGKHGKDTAKKKCFEMGLSQKIHPKNMSWVDQELRGVLLCWETVREIPAGEQG